MGVEAFEMATHAMAGEVTCRGLDAAGAIGDSST